MQRGTKKQEALAGDAAVAERFRYFLEAQQLDREGFVAGVDGAVSAKSLFSILSGARRPSRALAVLIERTWGFRAAFLLEGRGPMWRAGGAHHGDADGDAETVHLSPAERAVVAFMRRSVENARTLERERERAELWERLFARTMALIGELEACGASSDPGDRAVYPLFVKLVYEEAQFAATRYAQLGALHIRRRVHRLTDRYLERYLDEVPRPMLSADEHAALVRTLTPVQARRRRALRALDESIAALTTTLRNLVTLGSPRALLEATAQRHGAAEHAARLEALLAAIPAGTLPRALKRELGAAAAEASEAARRAPAPGERLQRLARDLLAGLEVDAAVASQSVEELRALHHATVAPLT
jgi:hypothetical protein